MCVEQGITRIQESSVPGLLQVQSVFCCFRAACHVGGMQPLAALADGVPMGLPHHQYIPSWLVLPHTDPRRKQFSAFHLVIIGSAPGLSASASPCWEEQPRKGAAAVRSGFSCLESWRDHISQELFPAR